MRMFFCSCERNSVYAIVSDARSSTCKHPRSPCSDRRLARAPAGRGGGYHECEEGRVLGRGVALQQELGRVLARRPLLLEERCKPRKRTRRTIPTANTGAVSHVWWGWRRRGEWAWAHSTVLTSGSLRAANVAASLGGEQPSVCVKNVSGTLPPAAASPHRSDTMMQKQAAGSVRAHRARRRYACHSR